MMSTLQSTLENLQENIIGKWTLNCIPFDSQLKLLGHLYVTADKLIFESKFDSSYQGLLQNVMTSLVAQSDHALLVSHEIYKQWKTNDFFVIPKSEIKSVEKKTPFFGKKIILTLTDDSTVVFNYGMLSIDKLYNAITKS